MKSKYIVYGLIVAGAIGAIMFFRHKETILIDKALKKTKQVLSVKKTQTPSSKGGVHTINTEAEFTTMIQDKNPKVIKFYADWCGACQFVASFYENLAHDMQKVSFYKINVDNENMMQLTQKNHVTKEPVSAMPTFIFIHDGRVHEQLIGALPKTEMEKHIKKVFSL